MKAVSTLSKLSEIAALVILYKPEEKVFVNIATYIKKVQYLYIIDNTPDGSAGVQSLSLTKKIKILHSGENIGIAKGINICLKQAVKDKVEWLMSMDQDSSFPDGQLDNYITSFKKTLIDKEVGLFSLQHNKKFYRKESCTPYLPYDIAMTSGSILNVKKAQNIGGLNEQLFIDEVDHEFCLRLRVAGISVLITDCAYLEHHLGTVNTNILGTQFRSYPPQRIYYMVRNFLFLKKQFGDSHSAIISNRQKYILSFVLKQIINNMKPFLYIRYAWKGVQDFKHKNMGYTVKLD